MLKRVGILVVAAMIGVLGLRVGEKMSIPGVSGVISPAHAVINLGCGIARAKHGHPRVHASSCCRPVVAPFRNPVRFSRRSLSRSDVPFLGLQIHQSS
jgi:hypothetical protein